MTKEEKIERKKNQKRERIIEAASVLFSENNFHEVMMDDVARQAGIAKGTLYNYYNSKEDLYFSIMLQRMQNLITSLDKKISRERDAFDSLRSFAVHNYLFMLKYRCFFLMMQKDTLKASNSYCEDLKTKKKELREMLFSIITEGKTSGLFGSIDADFGTDLVLGSIDAAVLRAICKNYSHEEIGREKEPLFNFLLDGLTGSKASLLPLSGRRVVITRSSDDSKESLIRLEHLGATVIPFPAIEIVAVEDWSGFDSALNVKWDILIFTSANSVRMFSGRIRELGFSPNYDSLMVVAVGNRTADELRKNSIPVTLIPKVFTGKGVAEELSKMDIKGKKIFIPGSRIAREELPGHLRNCGASVLTEAVYDVALPDNKSTSEGIEALRKSSADLFIFTSPSTFRNFLKIMNITEPSVFFRGSTLSAIGPTTKSEIESTGLRVDIMPAEHTMNALIDEAVKYYNQR